MKEELIGFKVAKLAKEKGFNITNRNSYDENTGLMLPLDPYGHCYALEGTCPAPTQSLLQKWLREKHNIDIQVLGLSDHYYVGINKKGFHECSQYFYPNLIKYEDNLEIGLLESLKLI